jgi:hypothetical protein
MVIRLLTTDAWHMHYTVLNKEIVFSVLFSYSLLDYSEQSALTMLSLFRAFICHVVINISKSQLYLFRNNVETNISRGSSVGVATAYGLVDKKVGVRVPILSRMIASPYRPDRLLGPPDLLPNEHKGLFSRGYSVRGVKLTSHLQLEPKSRKRRSIQPLSHLPGAQLN